MIRNYIAALAVFTLTLSGCATPRQHDTAPRSDATIALFDDNIIVGDGMRLPMRVWLPPAQRAPQAVIVALHGFNDYSNAFQRFADVMNEHDIAVYAYDQRGFGKAGVHGLWAGRDNLVADVADVVRAVATKHNNVPYYLVGVSMGGAVTLLASADNALPEEVDGIILSAPAVWGGADFGWLYRIPLWAAARIAPDMHVTGSNIDVQASDNIPMLMALSRDPNVIKKTRIDAIYGIVNLMDEAYQRAGELNHAALIMYGADDQIIPKEPMHQVMLEADGTRAAYYEDGFHMLLRDLQADVVYRDIVAWITKRHAPLPSGADREVASRLVDDIQTQDDK